MHHAECKEPGALEHLPSDSIYIKFKGRENYGVGRVAMEKREAFGNVPFCIWVQATGVC